MAEDTVQSMRSRADMESFLNCGAAIQIVLQGVLFTEMGDAKVGNLDSTIRSKQQIGRLDVAMDDSLHMNYIFMHETKGSSRS